MATAPAPDPAPALRPVPATPARAIVVDEAGAVLSEDALFAALAPREIVYVGERHDQPLHHQVQAAVLDAVASRRPGTVVAFEMLSIDQQPALDAYMSGTMPESDFADFWNKVWGYDFGIYKPIFDAAKARGLRAVALNAPRAIVKQVARGGISSLTPAQRNQLPPTIHPISNPDYLAYVNRALDGHGPLPPDVRRRMIEAQTVWNETMGHSVIRALAEASGPAVVVAGSGHMIYKAGIAESVSHRVAADQSVVLPYPMDGQAIPAPELIKRLRDPARDDAKFANYFWLLPG
jgi:uncharacterized iron-regulated protein